MTITLELLQKIAPKTKASTLEKFIEPLIEVCGHYHISESPERLAGFLANVMHESAYLGILTENLNYGAKGLVATFKKYFPNEEIAKQYERQPEKIANRVYANRMGNGDEASGDGWKYRGRGAIQLTGKHNYTRFAKDLGIDLDECVKFLETPEGAITSAAWFFDQNNLFKICDAKDWTTLTKRINGGLIGHPHRMELINQILEQLSSQQ